MTYKLLLFQLIGYCLGIVLALYLINVYEKHENKKYVQERTKQRIEAEKMIKELDLYPSENPVDTLIRARL
jgi:hypothetical protein